MWQVLGLFVALLIANASTLENVDSGARLVRTERHSLAPATSRSDALERPVPVKESHPKFPSQLTNRHDEKHIGAIHSAVAYVSRSVRAQGPSHVGGNASLLQTAQEQESKPRQSVCESDTAATYMNSVDRDLKTCMDKELLLISVAAEEQIRKDKVQDTIVACFGRMFARTHMTRDQCEAVESMLMCEQKEGKPEHVDMAIAIEKRRMRACPEDKHCFPGEASVRMQSQELKRMVDLNVGDLVLVEQAGQKLAFEPVLGFLHVARGGPTTSQTYLKVVHQRGELHISENHLLFVEDGNNVATRRDKLAMELQVGDTLLATDLDGTEMVRSKIIRISRATSQLGMYAPLTASGTVLVDGVLVSAYANSLQLRATHAVIHAILFPVRMFHWLPVKASFRPFSMQTDVEYLHPYVVALQRILRLS